MFISDQIKTRLHEIDCENLALKLGFEVRNHFISCPLHVDKTPSLHFKKNKWKCFSCGEYGDAITFVMMAFSLSFTEACSFLCDEYNIPLLDTYKSRGLKPKLTLRAPQPKPSSEERSFDCEVANFVIDNCTLGDEGKKFLFGERYLSEDVVSTQMLRSLEKNNDLFDKLLTKFDKDRLINCKILDDKGTRVNISIPSLVIPYLGLNGEIVALQTRFLGKDDRTPRFKMLCNSHVNLYNLNSITLFKENSVVVLTEGITDCLAALSAGFQAVAIQSATSIPDDQLYLLRKYDVRMIPDHDRAGELAFFDLYKKFLSFGVKLKKVTLPDGYKDYSEYYVSRQAAR